MATLTCDLSENVTIIYKVNYLTEIIVPLKAITSRFKPN